MNLKSNILNLKTHKKPPSLLKYLDLRSTSLIIPRKQTFSGHFGIKTPVYNGIHQNLSFDN